MAQLNFPSSPNTNDQYTGDNGVTYIYDGAKWIGHAVAQPAGTNSITNNGHTVQIDSTGNLVIPNGATIEYASGAPVVSGGGNGFELTSGTAFVSLDSTGNVSVNGNLPITTTNIPAVGATYNAYMSLGTSTTVANVVAPNNTIIVLASGAEVATTTNTVSTIISVVGLGLEWTRRSYYEDPDSSNHQRAEMWYAINQSGQTLTDNIVVTFDNAVDDQSTVVATYLGVNLNSPWTASGPVYSNSTNTNNSATITLNIAEPNSTGLVFFGVPWPQENPDGSQGPGYALNWTHIVEGDNGGAILWEYTTLSSRQFANTQTGLVVTSGYSGVGTEVGYSTGLTIIADSLVGAGSSTWTMGPTLSFPDGTYQSTAFPGAGNLPTRWNVTPAVPNGCPIYTELTPYHFSAYTQQSHLYLENTGYWDVGSNYWGTFISSDGNNYANLIVGANNSTGTVTIETAGTDNKWIFGADGGLTLPHSSRLQENTWSTTVTAITTGTRTFVTFAANEFNYPEQGQITISGVSSPTNANSTWYYQASYPNQVELHYNEDFASPVDSTSWAAYTSGGTVTLITQLQLNSNGNIWKFMADGSTIVPNGQRVIFGEQNGGAYIQAGMGFHINSTEGISLEAVDLTNPAAPVSHGWYFGPDGTFHFPDNSIQTTSAQVQFRAPNLPTGAAGDTQGALVYNTLTNTLYLATASYVQQVQTTSTFSIVSSELFDIGQTGGQFMSVTILKGTYAGIDTLLNAGITTGWTISGAGTITGTVPVTYVSLNNINGTTWSFDWAPVGGDPTSFSSGTAFTLYNTETPAQPNIWQQIVTGQVWQLSSSTETLSMYNPYTDYVELATNSSTRMSIYAGQGFELAHISDLAYGSWNWNQETTGTIVYQGIYNDPTRGIAIENYHNNSIDPFVLFDNNGGIQFNDYETNPLNGSGLPAFATISRTTGTMSIGVTDFTVNTGTTATWTFSAPDGTLTHPGVIHSVSTATVTSGVARTAWSNFLASQFNNSNSPFIVQDVQHDQAGNVIATLTDANTGTNNGYGNIDDIITINTQTSMVVKYSPEGAVLWSQQITGPVAPITFGLAVDSGNNIYINLIDLATTTTTVIKLLGTNGSLVWATDLTDAGDVGFNALIGPDGNLVVNGVYNNTGSNNMYLMKINSTTGSVMWQKQLPDPGSNDIDTGLAIDPNSGNIAVSGSAQGANLGFVGIVDSGGNYINGADFTVNIGEGVCTVTDAIYDSQGHLYVSGAVSTTSTVFAGFIAKIDSNLNLLWARQIGQGNGCIDVAISLVVDEHDNVYVSGFTSDPSNGGFPVTSLGSFAPDGTERWQYWFETPANTVTLPAGLGAEAFQNNFADLGNNTSYHNGMIALGVITSYNTHYYPYVLQVPADGTPVSFGDYGMNMLPIYSTTSTWAAITATVTVTTGLPLTVSAGTLTVATDVSVASAGIGLGLNGTFEYDYTTSTVYTSQQSWQFKPDGGLTFPDGTTQTTAYIPASNGEFSGFTDTGNNAPHCPIAIKNLTGYKRITGLANSAQTWFDFNSVASELNVPSAWISGAVIDFQLTSTGFGNQGNMVGQIIIATHQDTAMTASHSESAITSSNSSSDVVFTNLNMWQTNGVTLQALRTDSNGGQQLDIIWTARVFINQVESYC